MIKACVIGWPITHSRSPLIHGYWIKRHGLDASYSRVPVEPDNLAAFLLRLPDAGYAGCNVTLPHKEPACQIVKNVDDIAGKLGAANTIYIRDHRILATNTDGEGFINSLMASAPSLSLRNRRAVILGAGGAAVAVANALIMNGVTEIAVVNRSVERAAALHSRLGPQIRPVAWSQRSEALTDCDILINTTSLGMTNQPALDIDLERLTPKALVTDIVYAPLRTGLLVDAAARGHVVVEGLGMLLHQAVRGFELWFGVRPQVTRELHDLVAKDIDPAYGP